MQDKVPEGFFRDKLVVVGPSAPTLQDVHPTSTTDADEEMAGGEIHATAIDTIRRGFPLRSVPDWVNLLAVVLAGVLTPLLSLRLPALASLAIALAAGALYAVAAFVLFDQGHVVALTYPLLTLAVSAVAALAIHYVTAAFERERTRDMFARFVPEDVVGDVLKQAGGARLGGVARTVTIMFSDMRGFTSFSETLDPEHVITILNRYLTVMVDDAIDPHGGTLVSYMGDGIMAVFGAPLDSTDHADRALAAARAKLVQLERFNDWLHAEMGFEKSFRMGIGLNTGRRHLGQRRLAEADGLHDDRRHDEHRRAHRGDDEDDAVHAAHERGHPGGAERAAGRPRLRRRGRGPRPHAEGQAVVGHGVRRRGAGGWVVPVAVTSRAAR